MSFVGLFHDLSRVYPDDRRDRLQPPRDPTDGLSGYRKWMDGWFISLKVNQNITNKKQHQYVKNIS